MKIYEIERGSEAWKELEWAFTSVDFHTVRIAVDEGQFKVKVNEYAWSHGLDTKRPEKADA